MNIVNRLRLQNKSTFIQLALFLFVNVLFLWKYLSREGINVLIPAIIYTLLIIGIWYIYLMLQDKLKEKLFKYGVFVLLFFMLLFISFLLYSIDRYSVNVDRWSAVTFFLDGLFQGQYPYGIHTHVSETNFPSPFPVWHIINIPFYLMGDVGIGLIFFLLLVAFAVYKYTTSYKKLFIFLILLCLSPAYWWEVLVRSDSLSNAFLVFVLILWMDKKKITISSDFYLVVFLSAFIAATRLSAIIPVAIYLLKDYFTLSLKRKILFPLFILLLLFVIFSPFIFWDTTTWVFFSRNPFMSQTSPGNILVLLTMVLIGIYMAFRWKNFYQYCNLTSVFLFSFMLVTFITLWLKVGVNGVSVFEDSKYDISYFTLILPYCIACLVSVSDPKENLAKL